MKAVLGEHRLDDAHDEVLAPCLFAHNDHLKENWSSFQDRWVKRYAHLWRKHTLRNGEAAYKFLLAHEPTQPGEHRLVSVHCMCSSASHKLLPFETEWTEI